MDRKAVYVKPNCMSSKKGTQMKNPMYRDIRHLNREENREDNL